MHTSINGYLLGEPVLVRDKWFRLFKFYKVDVFPVTQPTAAKHSVYQVQLTTVGSGCNTLFAGLLMRP